MDNDSEKTWGEGDVFELEFPVEMRNKAGDLIQTVTSVQLKKLRGFDLVAIANASSRGQGDAVREMVSRMAGVPPTTFDLLDARDIAKLATIAANFIGSAPATGVM